DDLLLAAHCVRGGERAPVRLAQPRRGPQGGRGPRILPALGSALYKGVLLSTNSQPGWRDARWLGAYLTNSALMLGCAVMLLLAALLGRERANEWLRPSLVLLLVLNAVPLGLLVRNLVPSLSRVYTPGGLGRLGALCLGLGTLAPLALLL